jgi:hypothetical protein
VDGLNAARAVANGRGADPVNANGLPASSGSRPFDPMHQPVETPTKQLLVLNIAAAGIVLCPQAFAQTVHFMSMPMVNKCSYPNVTIMNPAPPILVSLFIGLIVNSARETLENQPKPCDNRALISG